MKCSFQFKHHVFVGVNTNNVGENGCARSDIQGSFARTNRFVLQSLLSNETDVLSDLWVMTEERERLGLLFTHPVTIQVS